MIGEVDFYGLFISPLLPLTIVALLLSFLLRKAFARAGVYRLVWHRPLFDFAFFVILLGALVGVTARWTPI